MAGFVDFEASVENKDGGGDFGWKLRTNEKKGKFSLLRVNGFNSNDFGD